MFKLNAILSRNELQDLVAPSDLRGWISVATTWGLIAAVLALVAWHPTWWLIFIALVILGGRHLALAILMHEAAHKSLFRSSRLNEIIGQWLCAYPTANDLIRYREHHLRHHAYTRMAEDPDLSLSEPFPVTKISLVRKFARDLFGVTGVKRIIGLILIDLGFYTYTISGGAKKIAQTGRTRLDILKLALRNWHGVVIMNALFITLLTGFGHPALYLLWIISYLTTYSVFLRVRSMAEHASTPDADDPLNNTRTTHAGILARVTVAPHYVNYHLEHHLLMTVPHYNLPRMHRLLAERGALYNACVTKNYRDVLRSMVVA